MELKLSDAVNDIVSEKKAGEYVLTEGEQLRIVAKVFGDWLGSRAKWEIREERHPDDPSKPGGLA